MLHDDEVFLRRVSPRQLTQDPYSALGWRVGSGDWDDPTDDPSVYAVSMLGEDPASTVLDGHPEHTVVEVTAGEIRAQSPAQAERAIRLDVVHRPDPDDSNRIRGEAHCAITGFPASNSARKCARKPLAERCRIVRLGKTSDVA